jgi:hypothetical protein
MRGSLPYVKDEPRSRLARAVLLGARNVTAVIVGSSALLDERRGWKAEEIQSARRGWGTGTPAGERSYLTSIAALTGCLDSEQAAAIERTGRDSRGRVIGTANCPGG